MKLLVAPIVPIERIDFVSATQIVRPSILSTPRKAVKKPRIELRTFTLPVLEKSDSIETVNDDSLEVLNQTRVKRNVDIGSMINLKEIDDIDIEEVDSVDHSG